MQIVIDLPEDTYIATCNKSMLPPDVNNVVNAIKCGTPLPEGHGRLIDADELERKMLAREEELGDDRAMWESSAVSVALDMFAQTIIAADKVEREGEE